MTSARPLFFVVLLVGVGISSIAAGEAAQAQTSPDSRQDVANALIAAEPAFGESSGLILAEAKPRGSNRQPATVIPLAKLDDGVCYTMRTYKVKRTERLSDGETGTRGFSTCELASNYQFRSAVAHVQTTEDNHWRNNQSKK
jgi:hypothetical protein